MCTQGMSFGCELRLPEGCSGGDAGSGCGLGVQAGGAGGPPSVGGPCPPTSVRPRMVGCFRKWLLHVAVVKRNERLCPSAPAPEHARASREGRRRGAGVQLGVSFPDGKDWGLHPLRSCTTVGMGMTCLSIASLRAATLRPPPCHPRGSRSPSSSANPIPSLLGP